MPHPGTTFRERLWEYLGQPDEETPERRRLLYAIVALRFGLGLLFLLRGWEGVFVSSADSFAARLGDPGRWGLSGLATDTVLFILGCTELGIGALLIFGAFTRVSAVTGTVLATLYLGFGQFAATASCPYPGGCIRSPFDDVVERSSLIFVIGGLLVLVFCGSPFLGADRALDKLEEEERDRAPARLPRLAMMTPLFLRASWIVASLFLTAYSAGLGQRAIITGEVANSGSFVPSGIFLALLLMLGFGWRIILVFSAAYLLLNLVMAINAGGTPPIDTNWLLAPLTNLTAAFIVGPGQWRIAASESLGSITSEAIRVDDSHSPSADNEPA
ncbi:MAG TPA: DoxX family membrane protein [Thermomicrobiales bacterium]|jgi:uncharacterized membrane protein YphA (DoxX/SURF4 family)